MNRITGLGRRAPMVLAFLLSTILVFGCGSDGGDDSPTDPGNPVPLSGYVHKGKVVGASVSIHAITATDEIGASVGGPFTTDAEGLWSGDVPSGTTGANAAFRMQLGAIKDAAFAGAIGDMTTALGFDPTTLTPPAVTRGSHDIYNVILAGFPALIETRLRSSGSPVPCSRRSGSRLS